MQNAGWMADDLFSQVYTGFYPAIYNRKINPSRFYADYVETYVKRDVYELLKVQDQRSFLTFLKLCAPRAGSLLNMSDLARDAGVSHTTAREWLSVLETSYILFFLPPYFNNYSKRLMKSPKLYFYDTGLLCFLLNIRNESLQPIHPSWGHLFENFIVAELFKQNHHQSKFRDYYFWRDSHNHEVDLLYPSGMGEVTYEIKGSQTLNSHFFDGLDYFKNISTKKNIKQQLIYAGIENQSRSNYSVLGWRSIE